MFNRIMQEKFYCGLDVGSQKIKSAIIRLKDSFEPEVIGVYETETFGYKDGSITDLAEISESIHKSIHTLCKKTSVKLKEVHLGVPGDLIVSRQMGNVIPLVDRGNKIISRKDVKKLNSETRMLGIRMEEVVLHDLPQHYLVDDTSEALNPLGLFGRKLGVRSLMILADNNRVRNLTKAVNQAGYDVSSISYNSYVASGILMTKTELQEGSVLVDIGSNVTSVLIFKNGVLRYLDKILMGGEHLTRAIAAELKCLSFELAEDIKKSYAEAVPSDRGFDEEILVKRESNYTPIKRDLIYRAIEPILQKLIEELESHIQVSDLFDQINHGITVIGGGALLTGLIERLGQDLNMATKLGQVHIQTTKPLSNAAIFSSAVGLAANGTKNSLRYAMSTNGKSSHWAQEMVTKFKELYQEYF